MSQDLKGIKKWRTSDYIRPTSIKAFLTVLLPQLTLGRARSLRPSLAQMPGDSQDTRPRPTACGDIRGGLITWLSVARGALLFCRCGRLLAPSVKLGCSMMEFGLALWLSSLTSARGAFHACFHAHCCREHRNLRSACRHRCRRRPQTWPRLTELTQMYTRASYIEASMLACLKQIRRPPHLRDLREVGQATCPTL